LTEAKERLGGGRQWDHLPSGQLRLRITDYALESARKTWSEGHRTRVEDLLNDFVVGLAVAADGLRARALHWKRWREEQEEAQRQGALAEQRWKEEEERIRVLDQQVDGWARAQQLRAFIDEVERRASAKGVSMTSRAELSEWLAWARRHADRLDPFAPPPPNTSQGNGPTGT
jgi:hypothetical protein